MADYIELAIAAVNVIPRKDLGSDDQDVPGTYSVMVQKGLAEPRLASAALDAFHEANAVDSLDDFTFIVFDPASGRVVEEDPEHESYSAGHLAVMNGRIHAGSPRVYAVSVYPAARKEKGAIGTFTIVAGNKPQAYQKALAALQSAGLELGRTRYTAERMA